MSISLDSKSTLSDDDIEEDDEDFSVAENAKKLYIQ